jgi:hypothetical protein
MSEKRITSKKIKRMTTQDVCNLLQEIDFDVTPQAYMVVFNEIGDRKRQARRKRLETKSREAFYSLLGR